MRKTLKKKNFFRKHTCIRRPSVRENDVEITNKNDFEFMCKYVEFISKKTLNLLVKNTSNLLEKTTSIWCRRVECHTLLWLSSTLICVCREKLALSVNFTSEKSRIFTKNDRLLKLPILNWRWFYAWVYRVLQERSV